MNRFFGKFFLVVATILALASPVETSAASPLPPKWREAWYSKEEKKVLLRWEALPAKQRCEVVRSGNGGKGFLRIAIVSANEYRDEELEEGVTYIYAIRSIEGHQVSLYSERRSVSIPLDGDAHGPKRVSLSRDPHRELVNLAPWSGYGVCSYCHIPHSAQGSGTFSISGALKLMERSSGGASPSPMPRPGNAPSGMGIAPPRPPMSAPANVRGGGTSPDPSYAAFGESFDEVWVVRRIDRAPAPAVDGQWPGCGELRAVLEDKKHVAVPLEHTEVHALVRGYLSRVLVTQRYRNPYDSKIEAVYVFPLPHDSAVSEFVMQIGERRIRGIIREREEAERIYTEAKRQGYAASLLTQERPNVFTQKVANIEPGKRIDIEVTYFSTLSYSEGEYRFVFPMVVGPRYNPPGYNEGVGAVARGSASASGQMTEVQYLRPEERSGHDIAVTVEIDAGVEIEKVYSNSHAVETERPSARRATVRLSSLDSLPNRDFVLRYRVAGRTVKSALMVDRDGEGGYFTLMLQPPGNLEDLPRTGQEMVFVLDTSGSMSGWPLAKSKAAMGRALRKLHPEDTFQIVRFAGDATRFSPSPVEAKEENVERGLAWVEGLRGGGGTQMIEGIREALEFPHDEKRLRVISFMTDGYIGNEEEIFQAVLENLGPARIFSFGIGNAVNRHLVEGLARLGRGAVAYVLTGDSDTEAVDQFYDRIRHPALTDISIDWGSMEVQELYPRRVPDLFVGRPVVVTGRFRGHGEAAVRVRGLCAGEPQEYVVRGELDATDVRHGGVSRIWARARIAGLSDDLRMGEQSAAERIRETALEYGLMSAYTAFVAVDESRKTEGDQGTSVCVPVPVPEGVRYDTTVQP